MQGEGLTGLLCQLDVNLLGGLTFSNGEVLLHGDESGAVQGDVVVAGIDHQGAFSVGIQCQCAVAHFIVGLGNLQALSFQVVIFHGGHLNGQLGVSLLRIGSERQ